MADGWNRGHWGATSHHAERQGGCRHHRGLLPWSATAAMAVIEITGCGPLMSLKCLTKGCKSSFPENDSLREAYESLFEKICESMTIYVCNKRMVSNPGGRSRWIWAGQKSLGGGGPNPDPFDTLKLFQMRDVTLFLILAPFCSSAVPTSLGWYYNKNGYGMIQYGYICVKIQETWTRRNRTYFDVHHPWFRVVASFDWDWYPTVSPSLSKMLCMGHSSIPQILDGSNVYLWLYRDVMYHWQCNISTYVM